MRRLLVDFLNDYYQADLKSIHDVAGNQHLVGNSKIYKCPLFVKIFKDPEMFYAEQHVNQVYYPEVYLDSVIFEDNYVVTLHDRELKDLDEREINQERAYHFGQLLGNFHLQLTGNVKVAESKLKLSEQLQEKVQALTGSIYQADTEIVLELLQKDFDQSDLEYEQIPKVVLHGDFSVRNIMEYQGNEILIDFERAHMGTAYQDFIKFFYNEVREPALRNIFLKGYSAVHEFEIPGHALQRCLLFLCALEICEYNLTHPGRKFGSMAAGMIKTIKNKDAILSL
ncbi:MAG: aminoglycoside phosphotransferase family protein [Liquorilactobacillus satsumensis]